jgi:hypothetical protein
MPSPEQPPPPKPPNLTAKQVPWGRANKNPPAPPVAPTEPTSPPPPEPTPIAKAPAFTAKLIPWGRAKKDQPAPPPPEPVSSTPLAPPPGLTAKQVPWGRANKNEPTPPPTPPEPPPTLSTWALPKSANVSSTDSSPGEALSDARDRAGAADDEPTAEQLVAILTRAPWHPKSREQPALTPVGIYKARPISYSASRWDVLRLWAQAHRWRLSLAGTALAVLLGMAYVWNLASLDAELDGRLHATEAMLRERYAAVPNYVKCVAAFGGEERYTLALTDKGRAAWRAARTEKEIAAAAAQMEMALNSLAKVMNRYAQEGVAMEPEQTESLLQFARLEEQRKLTRGRLSVQIQNYNSEVEHFNAKVLGVPGSWVAPLVGVHARAPLYTAGPP